MYFNFFLQFHFLLKFSYWSTLSRFLSSIFRLMRLRILANTLANLFLNDFSRSWRQTGSERDVQKNVCWVVTTCTVCARNCIVNQWWSAEELICVTTDVYFGYQKPPRLCLALLCIYKGFHFRQMLFREFTNVIETDWDAFETITIIVAFINNDIEPIFFFFFGFVQTAQVHKKI